MPRIAKQLSDRAVSAIRTQGRHAVGGVPGLHLRVSGGHRGWVLRVTIADKRKDMGLGPYPGVTLAEARQKARSVHDALLHGRVPGSLASARRDAIAEAVGKSFDWCAKQFLRDKESEWKNAKHRQQWENTLRDYASPHIGHMAVADIDLPHVLACLQPIWRDKNETASRVRGRIESVLDWATVRKYRSGENPARWRGHLDKVLPAPKKVQKVEHHRAVAVADMPVFLSDLRTRHGLAARALEFLILTAARSGEVRGARWDEIDPVARVWTVPASRMKAGKEHRVPLSDVAVKMLDSLPRIDDSPLLFPGAKNQPLSDMSLTAVMRRMNCDAVPHGFRSTFRDWAGDSTSYPRELAEAALAHTLSSAVEAAYRRSDALERRREMMNDWAAFCGDGNAKKA